MHEASTAWTPDQDNLLRSAIHRYGVRRWDSVAAAVPEHSEASCSARWDELQNRSRPQIRQPWTADEDKLLRSEVEAHGPSQWAMVASFMLGRTAKQCRERWRYQLDPSINRGVWSADEDALLVELQRKFGNAWSRIATHLPGRTDNAIKNRWHSARLRIRKREELSAAHGTDGRAFQVKKLSPQHYSDKSKEYSSEDLADVNMPMPTTLNFGDGEIDTSLATDPAEDFALWADLAACLLDDAPSERGG